MNNMPRARVRKRKSRLLGFRLLVAAFASECSAASGGAAAGARGDGAGAPRRLGAITGDEFLPEPLPHPCEMPPHLYPQRRYEHGTEPLLQDSEEQSEHERLTAQNGGEPPDLVPGWVKHLRLKVRQKSWIVPFIVTIDSKHTRTMTFPEFLPGLLKGGTWGPLRRAFWMRLPCSGETTRRTCTSAIFGSAYAATWWILWMWDAGTMHPTSKHTFSKVLCMVAL